MKKPEPFSMRCRILAAFAIALLAIGAVTSIAMKPEDQAQSSHSQQSDQPAKPRITAKYQYSAELSYVDIQLVDSRLTAVYLPTNFKPKENSFLQRPNYERSDLKHAEAKLTDSEVNQFIRLVKNSKFMEIKDHSGAPDGVRYYPTTISVELDGKKKNAEYRSRPDASPMPSAFADVNNWLMKTAWAKFRCFPMRL